MKFPQILILATVAAFTINCRDNPVKQNTNLNKEDIMVRIAEIEIYPEYFDEYTAVLKEESKASVRLEKGVICIFPMYLKDNPAEIRLLEIYADKESYVSHLKTPHFEKYKTTTLKMVKSLSLLSMTSVNPESMPALFRKIME